MLMVMYQGIRIMFFLDRELLSHKEPAELTLPPISSVHAANNSDTALNATNATNANVTLVNHVDIAWLRSPSLSAGKMLELFDAFTMRKAI